MRSCNFGRFVIFRENYLKLLNVSQIMSNDIIKIHSHLLSVKYHVKGLCHAIVYLCSFRKNM